MGGWVSACVSTFAGNGKKALSHAARYKNNPAGRGQRHFLHTRGAGLGLWLVVETLHNITVNSITSVFPHGNFESE